MGQRKVYSSISAPFLSFPSSSDLCSSSYPSTTSPLFLRLSLRIHPSPCLLIYHSFYLNYLPLPLLHLNHCPLHPFSTCYINLPIPLPNGLRCPLHLHLHIFPLPFPIPIPIFIPLPQILPPHPSQLHLTNYNTTTGSK